MKLCRNIVTDIGFNDQENIEPPFDRDSRARLYVQYITSRTIDTAIPRLKDYKYTVGEAEYTCANQTKVLLRLWEAIKIKGLIPADSLLPKSILDADKLTGKDVFIYFTIVYDEWKSSGFKAESGKLKAKLTINEGWMTLKNTDFNAFLKQYEAQFVMAGYVYPPDIIF